MFTGLEIGFKVSLTILVLEKFYKLRCGVFLWVLRWLWIFIYIEKLIIESDSVIAVTLLNSSDFELATIIDNCRALIQLFDYCTTIQHAHRERNIVSDLLAKDGINLPGGTMFFTSLPTHISQAVFEDISGTY